MAVLRDGRRIGWLGYEPYLIVQEGHVVSVDGKQAIEVPVTDRLP